MIGYWTLKIEEVIDTSTILVLVVRGTMIIIVIILTRGVTRDIF